MKTENIWLSSSVTLLIAVIFMFTAQVVVAADNQMEHVQKIDSHAKVKIRKHEEAFAKKKDKQHREQLKALIKQYRDSAKIVGKQGGNTKPLFDAVAYFQSQL